MSACSARTAVREEFRIEQIRKLRPVRAKKKPAGIFRVYSVWHPVPRNFNVGQKLFCPLSFPQSPSTLNCWGEWGQSTNVLLWARGLFFALTGTQFRGAAPQHVRSRGDSIYMIRFSRKRWLQRRTYARKTDGDEQKHIAPPPNFYALHPVTLRHTEKGSWESEAMAETV